MALDTQWKTLLGVYEGMGDEQLLALHGQLDDLTDTAQQALNQVMQDRGLQPSAHAAEAAPAPEAQVQTAEVGPDEVCLWTFDDAFQLAEAMRLLSEASMAPRVIDWNSGRQTDPFRGRTISLGVIVKSDRSSAARALLQRSMNLFPPPESDDSMDGDWLQVGLFARADALLVAHALGSGALSYHWLDGKDEADGDDDQVSIEVLGAFLDEAQELAQAALSHHPHTAG